MNAALASRSGADQLTRSFEVHVKGIYTAWEVPPRCRNPRYVNHETECTVAVPIVTTAEAPVVIRRLDATEPIDAGLDAVGAEYGALRGYDGRLFRRRRLNYGDHAAARVGGSGAADFPAELDYRTSTGMHGRGQGNSPAAFAAYWAESFADTLLVENAHALPDGSTETVLEVWEETSEPRYVVGTMGLGGNHGCTYLDPAEYDNPNIPAASYFRADDFAAARTHAVRVAQGRGDTESVPRIERQDPVFEILDASFVTLVVPTEDTDEIDEARTRLRRAAEAYERCVGFSGHKYSATEEDKAYAELVAARKALRALTIDMTGAEAAFRPYEARKARA